MSRNLGLLAESAAQRGGTVIFEGKAFDGRELFERSTRLAGGLAATGVSPGDRVVVLMANCPEVAIAYTALWRLGAVATPVVFLVSAPELRHVLVDSGAVAVITTPEFAARIVETGVEVATYVVGTGSYDELERGAAADLRPNDDDDLAALLYTGGTTGRSKGVMLSHAKLWSTARASYDHGRVDGVNSSINPLPMSHAYGLIVTVYGMHVEEPSYSVLMRWFDPVGFLGLIAQHRLARAVAVPSMLQMLLASPLEDYDLSSLRYVGSGAAPLAHDVLAAWERRVPSSEVLEGYGLTESGAVVSSNPPGGRRLGTVGRPIPGVEVVILDEGDRPLPVGEDGEIGVRGPGIMRGYWQAEEATAEALRGGWLHTGDIGHLDADGYLSIVDRKKDLIIRGGFNVYPRDVEDVLIAHPSVAAAAVVGRPDAIHGEEVIAFVAAAPGSAADPDELIAWCRARLSAVKYPREIRVVDVIPLTSVGKTDRKALRAQVGAQRD